MKNETYNGHKNYQTWNVSLWINNDEFLHDVARISKNYKDFTDILMNIYEITSTQDEVSFSDMELDFDSLNSLISEIE